MRIRKPIPNSSASSSSSSSSCSLSSVTNNSLASSTDSSSTSTSNSPLKCQGLDLLVKAIYQVTAGSVVGFPYIQKRVITRRRRRQRVVSFDSLFNIADKYKGKSSLLKRQQRKRLKSVPTKYQDSVLLQPKSKSRRPLRSVKVSEELGS